MRSAGIQEWLEDTELTCRVEDETSAKAKPSLKRKHNVNSMERNVDDTPRPRKKRMGGLRTPITSDTATFSQLDENSFSNLLSSTTKSSRSSSPNKRQAAAAIEYGIPRYSLLPDDASSQWISDNAARIPCFSKLLEITSRSSVEPLSHSPQLNEPQNTEDVLNVLHDLEECTLRSAPEEAWSDCVVLPILKIASRISEHKRQVKIMNVKSIDVFPRDLLPTNIQASRTSTKRVDYTVGENMTDPAQTAKFLQSISGHTVAQSNHKMVADRSQYAHFEIKATGSILDASSQLFVWCAAGFQKQEELWISAYEEGTVRKAFKFAPVTLWLWQEDRVQLWIAVKDSVNEEIITLRQQKFTLDEKDPQSVWRLALSIAKVMDWGHEHYTPWFRSLVSDACATS